MENQCLSEIIGWFDHICIFLLSLDVLVYGLSNV